MEDHEKKHHYTETDMLDMLVEKLEEELEDVVAYGELYKHFVAHEMYDEAELVEDIAREEYSHAEAICTLLKNEEHYPHSEKLSHLWYQAKTYFE